MSNRATALCSLVVGCLATCGSVFGQTSLDAEEPIPLADCHVHLLDFLQNGDYLENGEFVYSSPRNTLPAGERGKRIEALLAAMDDAGVSHAIVSGMPFDVAP